MLFAVVVSRVVLADDGDGHVDRVDLLVAVGDVEGDSAVEEVRVVVLELLGRKTHVRGAGVGAGRLGGAVEDEVGFLVERVRDLDVVAGDAVLFAVVVGRVVVANDGNNYLAIGIGTELLDLLIAIGDVEGHGCEVVVRVRELLGRETHVGLASIGARGGRFAAEREVSLGVERVGDLDVITRHGMGLPVILGRVVVARDGDGHVDRVDLLVAVGDVEGDGLEVRVVVRELAIRQAHVRGADVGALRLGGAAEVEVLRHVVEVVVRRGRVAGDAVLLAVVVGRVVLADDGDGHVDGLDLLVTVGDVEGDGLEVGVRVGELPGCQAHVGLSRIGARRGDDVINQNRIVGRREREVLRHIVEVGVCRGRIAGHGVCLAIVVGGVVRTNDSDDCVDLVDGLVAVGDVEGDLREVVVRVRELVGRKTHVGGAGVSAGRLGGAAEREVRLLVQRVADLHVVAGDAVLFTVVVGGVVIARDGDHDLVDRRDGLVAVSDVEGHVGEVGVRVGELPGVQTHVRGAHLSAFGLGGAAEGKVLRHVVEIGARGGGVATHRMLFAVVRRSVVVTDDGDGRIDRVDLLVAVGDVEGHGLEVRVRVLKLFRSQAHIGLAISVFAFDHVRARSRGSTGELDVFIHVVQVAVCNGDVIIHGVLFTVVVSFVVVARDGNHNVDGLDDELAVDDLECHVEVRVGVREVSRFELHVVAASVGATYGVVAAEREVLRHVVEVVVSLGRVARDRMLLTIVVDFVGVLGDGHLHVCRGYGQLASHGGDCVVGGHVLVTVHDLVALGDGVVALGGVGHVGDGAGGGGNEFVALEQLASGHGDSIVAVNGAIIGPALASSRDGDFLGGGLHRQLAIHRGDGVVAGRALGELVGLHLVGDGGLGREGDGALDDRGDGVVAHQARDVVARVGVGGAVVGEFLGLGRDGDGCRVDGEGSCFGSDHVVGSHILVAVHDLVARGDGVVALGGVGHVGDGAGGGGNEFVALEQLASGHGDSIVAVNGAIIGPALASSRDGDFLGGGLHRQLAIHRGDGVVAGRALGELVGLHLVGDGGLGREGDGALDDRGDGVVAHQARDVVARVGVGGAVVGEVLRLRRNGDLLRVDGELAVDLRHIREVRGLVLSSGVLDDEAVVHDVLSFISHIGGRARSRGLDGEALGQTRGRDRAIGESGAVIGLGLARCSQSNRRSVFSNGQRAKVFGDGVVRFLGVAPRNAVRIRFTANFGDGARGHQRDLLGPNKAFDLGIVKVGKGGTIVLFGSRACCDGDGLRVHGQFAINLRHIGEVSGLVVVLHVEDLVSVVHDVGGLAGVGLRAGGRGLDGEALWQAGCGDGGVGQRSAVVGLGVAGSSKNNVDVALRHGQRAHGNRCKVIVVRITASPFDAIVIRGISNLGLRPSGGDYRGFALGQACEAAFIVGKRSAVVRLACRTGGNSERPLRHLQLAFDLSHISEISSLVVVLRVEDLVAVVHDVGALAGVCLRAGGGCLDGEALGQAGCGDGGVGERRAVVDFGVASRGELHLGGVLGDGQRAELFSHLVVVLVGGAPIDRIGVARAANFGL